MKQVDEMPTSGQFVAVWENKNGVFSDTYLWFNDDLLVYDNSVSDFDKDHHYDTDSLMGSLKSKAVKYFVSD